MDHADRVHPDGTAVTPNGATCPLVAVKYSSINKGCATPGVMGDAPSPTRSTATLVAANPGVCDGVIVEDAVDDGVAVCERVGVWDGTVWTLDHTYAVGMTTFGVDGLDQ